jgi:hypothetical protein
MAASLGNHPGLNGTDPGHLRQGAHLPNFTTLCIPNEIPGKPGSLSPEKWSSI